MKIKIYFFVISHLFTAFGLSAGSEKLSSPVRRKQVQASTRSRPARQVLSCSKSDQNGSASNSPSYGCVEGVDILERIRSHLHTKILAPVSLEKKND